MAGYIRQSSFVDGDTITAALFNNEYNQLLNAFNNATGHAHDGTTAEGPVIGLIGDAGETAPNNKVLIDTTNNFVEFYVQVASAPVQQLYIADGAIIPVTDSDIDLGTSSLYFKNAYIDSITTTGNIDVGGNLTVTGTTTFNGGTITMGDAATDNVVFGADIDSNIIPDDDNTYDLGSTSQEWRNLYIDGTANIDSLVADTADINGGTIDGSIIGGTTAAAITGTAITGTSFVIGSADISEAELETIDGVTAGTVAASKAIVVDANKDITGGRNITITGEIDAATLDISGNADIDGTLEADAITINGVTLSETIADTVGAMVSSNTETGIVVSYDDADNTLDFVIGADAIVQSMIADDAIDSQHYVDGSIDLVHLSANSVDSDQYVDGSIDLVHMSINSIDSDQYVDGSIDLVHMSANSVDSDQYVDGSIDLIHMSANSVDSDQYVDGSIDTVHLADDAVTGAKLADNIDIAGTLDVTGILTADSNVVVAGNLTVNGTTTTLNTATLDVEDKNITINYGAGDTSASANGAGITIQDAIDASNDATILWDTTNDEFDFSHAINVAGKVTSTGTSVFASLDISGDIDVDGTTNLDVVDIDGAVDMASTALVTGVLTANGGAVFNETGADVDFRVESDTVDHALFVQGSDGSVGIGTSSPEGLEVVNSSGYIIGRSSKSASTNSSFRLMGGAYTGNKATAFLLDGTSGINSITFGGGTGAGEPATTIKFNTGTAGATGAGTERMRIDSSGNLLLNTTSSPTTTKAIISSDYSAAGTTNTGLTITGRQGGNWYNNGIHALGSSGLVFSTGTTGVNGADATNERMRIDSSGSVGIGTSSPGTYQLAVDSGTSGTSNALAGIFIEGQRNGVVYNLVSNNTDNGTDKGSGIQFRSGGFLTSGIIGRSDTVAASGDAPGYLSFHTSTDGSEDFAERLRIDSSGNVGIGTTSITQPSAGATTLKIKGTDNNKAGAIYLNSANDSVVAYIYPDSTNGLSINTSTSHPIIFRTVGTERLRIDSSGTTILTNADGLANLGRIQFSTQASTYQILGGNNIGYMGYKTGGYHRFFGSDGVEDMRLDSSGNLLVGVSASSGTPANGATIVNTADASAVCIGHANGTGGGNSYVNFAYNAGLIGSITQSGTTAVLYNTSSDGRLKDITGSARGLEVINELNPVSYNWKADGQADEGLIAQEVLDIVPNAVSGSEEDMYQMDYSKLVVHLVAGMKEQQTQIEALQSEINLLKGE
jgi:cytoskeletal protein CcmA (bactofilin family)